MDSQRHTEVSYHLHVSDIETVREEPLPHADIVVSVCQDGSGDNVGCDFAHYPLSDGAAVEKYGGDDSFSAYESAVDRVISHIQDGDVVHVHCHHGQSRSVSVVTSALAVYLGTTWSTAFEHVSTVHERSSPDPQLEQYGKRYVNKNL